MTRETLRIALLHMDVEYHNRGRNLAVLLDLVSRAASLGAKIICAPEMCLTGYVQKSLTAISNLAETDDGPAQAALSAAAMASGAFVAAGWAEKSESGVLYNASRVFAPDGTTVCRYKKINAESRWAAPGPNRQYNIFQTPWGAVGVLICADSYHSLLCRITAMRGASLILLPSNWPDDLWSFPELLWRQRAYENGVWLAAANRSGAEEELDFSGARSMVVSPDGELLEAGGDDQVCLFEIPLSDDCHIEDKRLERLEGRRPDLYHRVYGNLSPIRDLTGALKLPKPGLLEVHALAPGEANPVEFLERHLKNYSAGSVILLPAAAYSLADLSVLEKMAESGQTAIFGSSADSLKIFAFGPSLAKAKTNLSEWSVYDLGPARIMAAGLEVVAHPEAAVAAAKEGVDLLLTSAETLSEDEARLIALRPIEQLAAAACARNRALLALIPRGHGPLMGARAGEGQTLTYVVDTRVTRDKRFQDRVDFEAVFVEPLFGPLGIYGPK